MSNPKEKLDFVLLLKLLKIATLTDDVEKEEDDDQVDDKVENLEISGKNNVSIESTYITNIGKIFFKFPREVIDINSILKILQILIQL